jgi:IS605 OrfB family transposase
MVDSLTVTYQTRLAVSAGTSLALDAYARHYNHVERELYADMRASGKSAASFKNGYLLDYGLTARQFNAIGRNLEGKISSVMELLPLRIQETQIAIDKAVKVIKKVTNPDKLHQKKRRIARLELRLEVLTSQLQSGDPRICFGSRMLFAKQFNLEINGYSNHAEWRADWQDKRNSQFFVLGSGDETMGCQGCVASVNPDGSFNLTLRLPGKESRHVVVENVHFSYGHSVIAAAMARHEELKDGHRAACAVAKARAKINCEDSPEPVRKPLGPSLSYRFLRDAKGWRVMVTSEYPKTEFVSIKHSGAIGVDINAACLALAETNRHGNLVGTSIIPLVTYGKTSDQAEAVIGDVVKAVVAKAVAAKKPIVIEKLDFKKKRAALEGETSSRARMLSSFAYKSIIRHIKSAAYRAGVQVIEVNPAFTSVIGAVNFAESRGMSVHQGAAFAIARRGSGCRELPSRVVACVPTPKGDHVTFSLPERNREKHVWSFWAKVKTIHKEVLAAHIRPAVEDPSQTASRSKKRKCPMFTVRPRSSNRPQHCSVGVVDDIPY